MILNAGHTHTLCEQAISQKGGHDPNLKNCSEKTSDVKKNHRDILKK